MNTESSSEYRNASSPDSTGWCYQDSRTANVDFSGNVPNNKGSDSPLPAVVIIAGPTASGKSRLALTLAQTFTHTIPQTSTQAPATAVIINSDASQVYQDIPIISAQPDKVERSNIDHRLYGYIDGAEIFNAAQWAADARRTLCEVLAAGNLPILVGGSGLYLRILLDGIAPIPDIPATIRAEVRELSPAAAAAALTHEDREAAARLHINDTSRIARALEVVRATGTPLAQWQRQCRGGIAQHIRPVPIILLPPRPWLKERCERRLAAMFDSGARAEVARLCARKLPNSLPVMRAIGVRQISQWIDGAYDRTTALAVTTHATHQYAKRQYSWFRNQMPGPWPVVNKSLNDSNIKAIITTLQATILP